MAQRMIDGICKSLDAKFDHYPLNPVIEKQVILCIESITSRGCDAMDATVETAECRVLDEMQ